MSVKDYIEVLHMEQVVKRLTSFDMSRMHMSHLTHYVKQKFHSSSNSCTLATGTTAQFHF
jgi:hypothetical protein